jgi:hypothetical protein
MHGLLNKRTSIDLVFRRMPITIPVVLIARSRCFKRIDPAIATLPNDDAAAI